jgi:hypothetical protein
MFPLLMYAICAIVFFQGVALLQRMLIATEPVKSWRTWVIWIGLLGLLFASFVSVTLAYQFTVQSYYAGKALVP